MATRYNVIEVIVDQQHAGLMGCAGHPQALTPRLDAFAAQGVRFRNAYCQNPICTPSRVSVLSGQYCHNHGYYGLSGPTPARLPSFMGHFKRHGYRTAGFGKLHLPHVGDGNWLRHDLDRFGDTYEDVGGHMGRSEFLAELTALGLRDKEDSWHNPARGGLEHDAEPSDLPYEHTQEVWCVRKAFEWIDEPRDEPFCVQIAFQRPHHPLLPQPQFWDMYEEGLDLPATFNQAPSHRPPHFRRMWERFREKQWAFNQPGQTFEDGARRAWRGTLACVTQCDDVFGMVLDALAERGLSENTIVIYHSDHGCYHGMHGIEEKAPGICSDAVCRVPMIWRVPGVTPAGLASDALAENVDLAPTIAHLCGLPPMDWVDGVDLSPILQGRDTPVRDTALTENPWSKAIRIGPWRFVYYPRRMFGEDVGELYNIEADPDETRNLYHDPDHQGVVAECKSRLLERLIETTRNVTCHPAMQTRDTPGDTRPCGTFDIAEDGKESNQAGPDTRLAIPDANYL